MSGAERWCVVVSGAEWCSSSHFSHPALVIRALGKETVCPRDGRTDLAYYDAVAGAYKVGRQATEGGKRVGRSEWGFGKRVGFAHSLTRDPQGVGF